MPLQATAGAATYDAFGGGVTAANYIEDVFSTFLYTGTGSGTQTITNGIDLAGKGGLVWIKSRTGSTDTTGHALFDTARGREYGLATQLTSAQQGPSPSGNDFSSFNSDGFTVSATNFYWTLNPSGASSSMVSWTFRKQPKFFDVVTYTGNGSNRTISHSLGSVPGCIIVKRTDAAADWQVYHRSLANTDYLVLNSTAASATGTTRWNSTTPTATEFSLGTDTTVNASGGTYVAYLFAHDAGGFGASGTDNVISCGQCTGFTLENLGWEPQLVLVKGGVSPWRIYDSMRMQNLAGAGNKLTLRANNSSSESGDGVMTFSATGFTFEETSVYIAIRRGPMRTPTSGTSVFAPSARSGTGAAGSSTALGNVTDLAIIKQRGSTQTWAWTDRLRGATNELTSAATTAETAYFNDVTGFDSMTGFLFGSGASGQVNSSGSTYIDYLLRRAPGFFDVVCYTGDGAGGRAIPHNLGAAPELIVIKGRSVSTEWGVYTPRTGSTVWRLNLNQTTAGSNTAAPMSDFGTASNIFVGTGYWIGDSGFNANGSTYVAYLFATVAGVSKVGSYTGTGTTLQVNCGFTAGARFVLIKRADSTGDWYVWDSARGIVAGNDPYLLLNDAAAEVTSTDYVDTYSAGFEISSTAPAAINANGGTFIFLAIA